MEIKEKKKMNKWNRIILISLIVPFILGAMMKNLPNAIAIYLVFVLPVLLILKSKDKKNTEKNAKQKIQNDAATYKKSALDELKSKIGKNEEEIFENLKKGVLFEKSKNGYDDKYKFHNELNYDLTTKGSDEWIYKNNLKKAWANYVAYQNEKLPSYLSRFNNYVINDLKSDASIKNEIVEFNESQLAFDSFIKSNEIQTLDHELFTTLSEKLSEDNRRSIIRIDKHIEKYIDNLKNHIDVLREKKVYNMEEAIDKSIFDIDKEYQTSIAKGVINDPSLPLENRITTYTELAYYNTLTGLKEFNRNFIKSINKVLKLYFDVNALISLRNLMLIYFRENNLIFYDKVYLQFEELGFLFSEYENRSLTSLDNIQLSISNLTEKIEDGFARISSGLNTLAENQELQLQSMSKLLNKQDKALNLQNIQNSKLEKLSGQVSFANSNLVLNNFLQYRQLSATKNIMKELKK